MIKKHLNELFIEDDNSESINIGEMLVRPVSMTKHSSIRLGSYIYLPFTVRIF